MEEKTQQISGIPAKTKFVAWWMMIEAIMFVGGGIIYLFTKVFITSIILLIFGGLFLLSSTLLFKRKVTGWNLAVNSLITLFIIGFLRFLFFFFAVLATMYWGGVTTTIFFLFLFLLLVVHVIPIILLFRDRQDFEKTATQVTVSASTKDVISLGLIIIILIIIIFLIRKGLDYYSMIRRAY